MTQNIPDPLQKLRDIHLPAAPDWWPPAPGWWLLGLLGVAALVALLTVLLRWRAKRAPMGEALHQLEQLRRDYASAEFDATSYVDQADALVKRVLIHTGHREEIARLSGATWLAYLAAVMRDPGFADGPGSVLGSRRFKPDPQLHTEELYAVVRQVLLTLRARA